MKLFVFLGSIHMFLAIALGAFGAHGLTGRVSEKMIANWNTGAHYHLIHGLALIAIGILIAKTSGDCSYFTVGGWLLFAGILLFSGSLYVLVLTGVKTWGAVTPLGGIAFLIGWICTAIGAWKYLS